MLVALIWRASRLWPRGVLQEGFGFWPCSGAVDRTGTRFSLIYGAREGQKESPDPCGPGLARCERGRGREAPEIAMAKTRNADDGWLQ